jgi:transposase
MTTTTTTIQTLVPDDLWQAIQPLLPPPPRRYGGRPRIDDRACLAGIVYQAAHRHPLAAAAHPRAGLRQPGHLLATAARLATRRRLAATPSPAARPARPCQPARLVEGEPGQLERARQARGALTGPNPVDRGKPGSKYHLLVDRNGIPLAVGLSAASTHDSMLLEAMVDAVLPVKGPRGRPGRPRQRPAKLHLDKGYDYPRCRRALRARGITPRIARRGIESSERLGRHRWVIERSLAWLVGYRRLQVRYERRADILLAFCYLACTLICLKALNQPKG